MTDLQKTRKSGKNRQQQASPRSDRPVYPFVALVGQEEMKLALILNVIDERVGGALIMGHRGTAKSTAVRALADLLPEISAVVGCGYRCDPGVEAEWCDECRESIANGAKRGREKTAVRVVELPLGATEDRVCGTIDIEHALRSGTKQFEPGLLARANRGFLYLDEANLLEDHLVDLLLDVAASGINQVEREGISIRHPARFVLIGSGNPEEGELRPQLLDRFGLYVEVKTETELDRRIEIIERREAFELDGKSFQVQFANQQTELRRKIVSARRSLPKVKVERRIVADIARLCSMLKTDGHRGELTIIRAARAVAAFSGRRKVDEGDVRKVAVMALRHRLRRDALAETPSGQQIEQAVDEVFDKSPNGSAAPENADGSGAGTKLADSAGRSESKRASASSNGSGGGRNGTAKTNRSTAAGWAPGADETVTSLSEQASTSSKKIELKLGGGNLRIPRPPRNNLGGSRGRAKAGGKYNQERGRYARSSAVKAGTKVALDATLRAAAATVNRRTADSAWSITAEELRFKLFKRKQGCLFIFAIDLSGSMALNRIGHAKEMILGLLRQSYLQRDSVAIVGFRGTKAEIMLPPSKSILRGRRVLESLPVGGSTPLSAGLASALELGRRASRIGPERVLLIFTDGGANVSLSRIGETDRTLRKQTIYRELGRLGEKFRDAGIDTILVNTQKGFRVVDETSNLAQTLGARLVKL